MKNIIITFCALCVFAVGVNAQNLAGVSFDATMGVLDAAVPCMVDAGTQNGLDIWTNNGAGCPGDGSCGTFTNIVPQYNTFEFKNVINIDICINMNFVTGSCGFNTGFWIADGVWDPTGPAGNRCSNNVILQSSDFGGTTSVGFTPPGCSTFSVNAHNGTAPSAMCTYSINFDPDPLLDLRCADDTAVCVEKVKIGGTPVPTMTQWGLFLFGLIVLTLGVVTIYNMSSRSIEEKA